MNFPSQGYQDCGNDVNSGLSGFFPELLLHLEKTLFSASNSFQFKIYTPVYCLRIFPKCNLFLAKERQPTIVWGPAHISHFLFQPFVFSALPQFPEPCAWSHFPTFTRHYLCQTSPFTPPLVHFACWWNSRPQGVLEHGLWSQAGWGSICFNSINSSSISYLLCDPGDMFLPLLAVWHWKS